MTVYCGLIKGRHKLPDFVVDFVFDSDIPQEHICDAAYLDEICEAFLEDHADGDTLCVFVTGFTPAMLALVKACAKRRMHLGAMNFDRERKIYWYQEVI